MTRASAGEPGADDGDSVVYDLDADCTADDVDRNRTYLAEINGIVDYGVFVDLSESISGLVHESVLEGTFAVGDELAVELESVRDNGDMAFEPADVDLEDATVEAVSHEYSLTGTGRLEANVGEQIHLEGEIVQVKQTGGPTIFHIADEDGVVPCAAFEEAGVRAIRPSKSATSSGSPGPQNTATNRSRLKSTASRNSRARMLQTPVSASTPHSTSAQNPTMSSR